MAILLQAATAAARFAFVALLIGTPRRQKLWGIG